MPRNASRRRFAWAAGIIGAGVSAAVALASDHHPDPLPKSLMEMVQDRVVAPVQILASARIQGVADTIGPVSPAVADRLDWFQQEVEKVKHRPSVQDMVSSELIDAAYASGVSDALRYGYDETQLDAMVLSVGAVGQSMLVSAFDIRGKLVGAGLPEEEAATMAFHSVQAGARSAVEKSDLWIADLASRVDSWNYQWACKECGPEQEAALLSIPFDGMMQVAEQMDDALLFSLNDRLDVTRAFAAMEHDSREIELAELSQDP